MKDGQQIRFSGEGDQSPDLEAGDVVIVLDEKEHNVFQHKGIDLLMQQEITLTEALCGFQHSIQTPDNRQLIITSLPGFCS
jgi:DnaJ-class molecular chaperone